MRIASLGAVALATAMIAMAAAPVFAQSDSMWGSVTGTVVSVTAATSTTPGQLVVQESSGTEATFGLTSTTTYSLGGLPYGLSSPALSSGDLAPGETVSVATSSGNGGSGYGGRGTSGNCGPVRGFGRGRGGRGGYGRDANTCCSQGGLLGRGRHGRYGRGSGGGTCCSQAVNPGRGRHGRYGHGSVGSTCCTQVGRPGRGWQGHGQSNSGTGSGCTTSTTTTGSATQDAVSVAVESSSASGELAAVGTTSGSATAFSLQTSSATVPYVEASGMEVLPSGSTLANGDEATVYSINVGGTDTAWVVDITSTTSTSATQLVWTTSPAGGSAGSAETAEVTLENAAGQTVADAAGSEPTLSFSGTGMAPSPNGTAASATDTYAAGVYTVTYTPADAQQGAVLTASATGVTAGTSGSFNVKAGAASALPLSAPTAGTSSPYTNSVTVGSITDADGNVIVNADQLLGADFSVQSSSGSTIAVTGYDDSTDVLTFTSSAAETSADTWTVTYTNTTQITNPASGSVSHTISPSASATMLVWTTSPAGGSAGSAETADVTLENASGQTVADAAGSEPTLSFSGTGMAASPNGTAASATYTYAAGVYTVTYTPTDAQTGAVLTASASGVTAGTSGSFTLTAGAAAVLPLSAASAGTSSPYTNSVTVGSITDADGNVIVDADQLLGGDFTVQSSSGSTIAITNYDPTTDVLTFTSSAAETSSDTWTVTYTDTTQITNPVSGSVSKTIAG